VFIGARASPQILEQVLGAVPSADIKVGLVTDRRNGISSMLYSACAHSISKFAGGDVQLPSLAVNLANGSVAEFFAENKNFLEKLVEDKIYAEQSYVSFANHIYQVMESSK